VVVEDGDPEGVGRSLGEAAGGVCELDGANASRLLQPGADRVEADNVQALGAVGRLRRLPPALELLERAREARERGVGDVVIPRNGEDRTAQALEELGRAVVLVRVAPVRQVAARDDQLRIDPVDQVGETRLDSRLLAAAHVEIGEVKESCPGRGQRRGRLYTQVVVDEPTEIFDDLYLGLRAGGALRKKRRGEPLTSEEEEALGRWQRLGRVRKVAAIVLRTWRRDPDRFAGAIPVC
jgi:hypothetical protein